MAASEFGAEDVLPVRWLRRWSFLELWGLAWLITVVLYAAAVAWGAKPGPDGVGQSAVVMGWVRWTFLAMLGCMGIKAGLLARDRLDRRRRGRPDDVTRGA